MVVRNVISDIKRLNPDWTRPDLLDILNKCYRILMEHPSRYTLALGDDGLYPEITPTTNIYTITDAYKIYRVYSDGNTKRDIGRISGSTITFTDSQVGSTFRVIYYKKVDELLTESTEFDFPEEHEDALIDLCNERIAYFEHRDTISWMRMRKEITKNFWYELNKYDSPSNLDNDSVVSKDLRGYNRSRYGSTRSYGDEY